MQMKRVDGLDELDHINRSFTDEVERIKALTNVYSGLPANRQHIASLDPFSIEYLLGVRQWLEEITGRQNYDPARDELSNYLPSRAGVADSSFTPSIYE